MWFRPWVPIALITTGAAAIRLPTLSSQSYWYDESITVSLVHRSFFGMLHGVAASESTPPLYYVFGWFWARIFGTGEAELRLLSALIGIAIVPVVYAATQTLASRRAALVVGALAATNPMLVWYSQEARAYSLFVLLSSASFLFFARALNRPTPRSLAFWTLTSALALATHYFAVFVVAPELILLVASHARMRQVQAAVASLIVCGAALLPLAVDQTSHNRFPWIRHIPLSRRSGDALRRLLVPSEPSFWWGATGAKYWAYLWIPALVLVLLAAALLVARGEPMERRAGGLALVIGIAALTTPILLSYAADRVAGGRGDSFLDRNVLSAWLPLNLFAAIGLTIGRFGNYGLAVASALCLGAIAVTILIAVDPSLQRDDWRSAASAADGSREAVLVYPAFQAAALLQQRPRLADLPAGGAGIERIVLLLTGGQHRPQTFRVPAGFASDGVRRIQNFTVLRFRADHPRRLRPGNLVRGPLENSDLRILMAPA
jgi:mannosyltransferase